MKSRNKKSLVRSIIRRVKEITGHPEWWNDKNSQLYAPYIQEVAWTGLYPCTWAYSDNKDKFEYMFCEFVYTTMSPAGKIRHNIGAISISPKGSEANMSGEEVHNSKWGTVIFDKNYSTSSGDRGVDVGFEVIINKKPLDVEDIKKATSMIADILTDFHNARILVVGAHQLNHKIAIEHISILVSILESYWDYAVGGCTHMYRMKTPPEDGGLPIKNMFEKFEISEEDIQFQKDQYLELKSLLISKVGNKSFTKIENRMAEDKAKSKPRDCDNQ